MNRASRCDGYSRRGYLGIGPSALGRPDVSFDLCAARLRGLGALIVRDRSREIWLGAALFGWGYLILAFGLHPFQATCPYLVTGHFLSVIRPWFPSTVSGLPVTDDTTNPANIRILKMLEQPIPMRFPKETSLEDVLKYIKKAATGADGKSIPIYIDPIGLQESEKSLTSTITIDVNAFAEDDLALMPENNSGHVRGQRRLSDDNVRSFR